MVNTPKDDGFTRKQISEILIDYSEQNKQQKPDGINRTVVELVDMEIGYTWTNALNYAMFLALAQNSCLKKNDIENENGFKFILNISVEAILTKLNLNKMINAFNESENIVVVGTTFKPIYPQDSDQQQQKIIELGSTYKNPRNTCMLIKLNSLRNNCGLSSFEAWCDNINGMEDFYFLIQMLILNENAEFKMLDLKTELLIGINFNQKEKQEREMKAIELIVSRFKSMKNQFTSKRIDWAISKVLENIEK